MDKRNKWENGLGLWYFFETLNSVRDISFPEVKIKQKSIKGPGGSPKVGGREFFWAYFNSIIMLTLRNDYFIHTVPNTVGFWQKWEYKLNSHI